MYLMHFIINLQAFDNADSKNILLPTVKILVSAWNQKEFLMKKVIPAILVVALLSACANPEEVDVRKIGDKKMSCKEISEEYYEADRFEGEAKSERGVTGKNVAAGLLFWPALLVTYSNVGDAVEAAKERKRYLTRLADDKNCDL